MTRKDYINIAGAILATQARIRGDFERQMRGRDSIDQFIETERDDQLRGVRRTAAHLADFLKDDNPRFDQVRFLKACGYGATTMNPRDPALDLRPLPEHPMEKAGIASLHKGSLGGPL